MTGGLARATSASRVKLVALVLNAALFVAGLYFEARPQDRRELWSAGGVAAVAVLNSAALTVGSGGGRRRSFRLRLRRIALLANVLLVVFAFLLVGMEAFVDARQAVLHGLALLPPPLVTVAALRGERPE